jgi:O-antigen/teichoic acid export membrane protein
MVFTVSKVLVLIATIIFAVGFGVLTFGNPEGKFLWQALLIGLTFFAASFLVP